MKKAVCPYGDCKKWGCPPVNQNGPTPCKRPIRLCVPDSLEIDCKRKKLRYDKFRACYPEILDAEPCKPKKLPWHKDYFALFLLGLALTLLAVSFIIYPK